ncbi:double homeobox protein B isoform X2 [Fukomys damarensis]|uniref:double homeobox protein B isoform X2 n=1 Tax=Fukomys damarensis TaxID=885580 RepID=UPI00053F53B0|nr:double homeobox protein B isoform X2 [Fukomys damarensis]
MEPSSNSNGRRQRMILNESQKDILNEWFEKNPYPGIDTRDYLAKVTGISEFQILTWFQNQRTRRRRQKYKCNFGKCQTQVQDKLQFKHEARQIRTNFTRSQIKTLTQAHDKNHFPGIAARKQLAKQTGISDKKIVGWFLNQRAWHQHQRIGETSGSMAEDPHQIPHASDQLPPNNHSTNPNSFRHLSPSNAVISKQSLASALFPPLTPFGPQDFFRGSMSQFPRAKRVQPSQAVQRRENCHVVSIDTTRLSMGMTLGVKIPLCTPNQRQCQDPSEHTGSEILPSKHSTQPPPDSQQWLDLGQIDPHLFLQHWDEWLQSVIAEWDPCERTPVSRKN